MGGGIIVEHEPHDKPGQPKDVIFTSYGQKVDLCVVCEPNQLYCPLHAHNTVLAECIFILLQMYLPQCQTNIMCNKSGQCVSISYRFGSTGVLKHQ